jgi:hypothetical protein
MKGALKVGSLQKPDGDGEGLSSSNRSAAGEAPGSNVWVVKVLVLLDSSSFASTACCILSTRLSWFKKLTYKGTRGGQGVNVSATLA